MLYQALLGAWQPDDASFAERMQEYALKAAREGKQETSWLNPHAAYEAGVKDFIEKILDPSLSGEFLNTLQTLAQRLSLLGALNSLSQITLKATMPGVPDFYQGTELWDFSLVDPDNRRPVDFDKRACACSVRSKNRIGIGWTQDWPSGHLKLAWTRHMLELRTELAGIFADGDYPPLEVSGPHRDHFIASPGGAAARLRYQWSRAGLRRSPTAGGIGPVRRIMTPRLMSAAMRWKALPMPMPRNCGCRIC